MYERVRGGEDGRPRPAALKMTDEVDRMTGRRVQAVRLVRGRSEVVQRAVRPFLSVRTASRKSCLRMLPDVKDDDAE